MREVHRSQFQLGQVPIEEIWINPKSRDDIPAVLKGLQHIWSDEELRARLLALLDEHILPEADRTVGRPGMDLWQILVLGVLKQGLGCDFEAGRGQHQELESQLRPGPRPRRADGGDG